MKTKSKIVAVAFAAFILLVTAAIAQPVPQGPYGPGDQGPNYPSIPDYPGPNYPSTPDYPGPYYPNVPDYPGPQPGPEPTPGLEPVDGSHPSDGPSASQPLSAPSGSNTEALNYAEGQSLSQQEVSSSGLMASGSGMGSSGSGTMAYMMVSGLQVWTWYNGIWTTNPAAVYFWRSTSLLTYNDQSQTVWSWERYPNGQQGWRNLGYRMPGYIHGRFIGDARGWHELAMWGSRSGWSNVAWIYVW